MHGDDDQIVPYRRFGAADGQAAEKGHAQDLQGPAARLLQTHPEIVNADILAFIRDETSQARPEASAEPAMA